MRSSAEDGAGSAPDECTNAATVARSARYRAAHLQLIAIHQELVEEGSRLAAMIEARLSPRPNG